MTDHHPDDDLIRDSLRAEADGIHAGDHMLDRIRSEATRPSRIRQVGPWLLAGAAVVAAVALVATVLQDDKPETVDTAGDPPTTEEAPPTSAPESTETTATSTPGSSEVPEQPTLVALVREDGWLVTVDLATGQETELYSAGDPRDEIEGGPYFIDAVDLSPDGQWIYFSTCCEPAAGISFRIPVTGGNPEQIGFGAYPRVSPDGRFVATADSVSVSIYRADSLGDDAIARVDTGCCISRLAWSPDGTRLAFVYGQGSEGGDFMAGVLEWDGANLTVGDLGKPENPGYFVTWMPDGMPVTSEGEPIADDRVLTQDVSYHWLLRIRADGRAEARAGHESSEMIPLDLPPALAADW